MDSNNALDALIFRYLERVDAGETGAPVLAELALEHPAQADALARGVRLLRDTRLHPGPSADGLPETVGPFRLLRKLGAGGMGVVYVAEQDHPRRRVALKLVRPDQLYFEGSRARFEREIQSVARLSHPGIAAILEMGEHEGVPWFSQELILGIPLSELLAGLPVRMPEGIVAADAREVLSDYLQAAGEDVPLAEWDEDFYSGTWTELGLRITRQVADALQHAHERGVLHRDVKPANVLLTPGGRAVLVDFGLASMRGTDRITHTGEILGSLHYMPPEQLDGRVDEIGPRSDVYSLGVTLYEFLTLRAPYSSQSVERLRGMILRGEAPDARKINTVVPRDAAIVCATAMEPAIARRYASAVDLGADVAAVLGQRTISARPAGAGLRLVRWAQRHPARAVGGVATFLLVLIGPLAFGVQRDRAAKNLARVNKDLEGALATSKANLESATQAIERVMLWTAGEGLDDVPGMLELRVRVIEEALDVFAGLLETRPEDLDLLFQQAVLLRTKGAILGDLERRVEAEESYRLATSILAPIAFLPDAPTRWIRGLAHVQHLRAQGFSHNGQAPLAAPYYRASLDSRRRCLRRQPDSLDVIRDTGLIANDLAVALHATDGSTAEARALLREALEMSARALTLDPDRFASLTARAAILGTSSEWSEEAGDLTESLHLYEESIVLLEHALELRPLDRDQRVNLVARLRAAGRLENLRANPERAEEHLRRALALIEEIVAENPGVREFAEDHRAVLGVLAGTQRARGDRHGAYVAMKALVEEAIEQAQEAPGDVELQVNASVGLANLANFALVDLDLGDDRIDLVLAHLRRAQEILERTEGAGPYQVRRILAMIDFYRGSALYWRDDVEGLEQAIEALIASDVDESQRYFNIAFLWYRYWQLTDEDAARDEAVAWIEKSVDAGLDDLVSFDRSGMQTDLDDPRLDVLRERVRLRAASGSRAR